MGKKALGFALSGVIAVIVAGALIWYFVLGGSYQKTTAQSLEQPSWRQNVTVSNPNYLTFKDEHDIIRSTDSLGGPSAKYYSKYIDYIAPNGKPIRIVAQNEVTDEQVLYTYALLSFYLEQLGSTVADQMANNNATLVVPNGADRDGKTPTAALFGQNLHQAEIANVGSAWYINNDYKHRDAAFEEIFHMVHDYGIGTTQNPQANSDLAKKIAEAQRNALPKEESQWGKSGLWGLGSGDWLKELSKEGSLEQEYIVSVIDSYYGLWEPYTEGQGGMWGMYVAKNRAEVKEKDPQGYSVLTSFLPEALTPLMRVDPSFEGTFSMKLDQALPYTAKSQYLTNVSLTGTRDSGLVGNASDNVLMGNAGKNAIDGGEGTDVVQLRGASSEYTVESTGNTTTVTDSVEGRDGTLVLTNVETLRFTDKDTPVTPAS
ncbi:MAG: hypothetical protein CSA82_03740 [Actinobacteria bacterium]|nr:MAG: hypothetical protein CSA82_03740 [Actinomycetota bacterium]